MYQFSRAIFRELVDDLPGAARRCDAQDGRREILAACEHTVERLRDDRYHFAHPARSLIRELRPYFPLVAQLRMRTVVTYYIARADEFVRAQFATGYDFEGNALRCRSVTRQGLPCRRVPLASNGYCPSHQHLAEPDPPAERSHESAAA